MADAIPPTKLTQINRHVHTDNSGIEIIRSFHCIPYRAHPYVQKMLQGSVKQNGEWKRSDPMADPYIPNCFCTSTRVEFADADAMATATSMGYDPGQGNLQEALEDQQEELADGVAGAIIHAHYRPLVTATPAGHDDQFDWMDVKITPGFREFPWPGGYIVTAEGLFGITATVGVDPAVVGKPVFVPVSDVSIRRILVGDPSRETISACAGCINEAAFPNHAAKDGLGTAAGDPLFPAGTLRYLGADIQYMLDTEGSRWYEVKHNFQWVHAWTEYLFDSGGNQSTGWVTWNHMLLWPRVGSQAGWYEVSKEAVPPAGFIQSPIPWLHLSGGKLHLTTDFLPLFKLNP